jgi:hypothetical protein
MRSRSLYVLALGLCGAVAWGCSSADDSPLPEPELQPVKGKVTIQGQPLAQAVVTFLQVDEKGTTAVAETGEDGSYEPSHLLRPGAAAADYKVAISYLEGTDGMVYGLGPRSGLAKPYGMITAKERIPEEWSNLGKTTQRVTVPIGGGEFNFDIKEPLLSPPEPPKDQPNDAATPEAKPGAAEAPPAAPEPKKDAAPDAKPETAQPAQAPAPEVKPGV